MMFRYVDALYLLPLYMYPKTHAHAHTHIHTHIHTIINTEYINCALTVYRSVCMQLNF